METKRQQRRTDDPLWKAIIEQTFSDFLTFFYPNAEEVFDLNHPFDHLDKEFESLFPPQPYNRGVRYVDKLVKVKLRKGGEQFVLVHVEAQSTKGQGDLARRMFEYFCKISEKYGLPVSAIAILTDDNLTYHPTEYRQEFLGTVVHYIFNSYKVIAQDEIALRQNPNPFAVVVLTALLALQNRQPTDKELTKQKLELYEEMMSRKMDRNTRQGIFNFLTYYVNFENPETTTKFVEHVKTKLGRSIIMNTDEYLAERFKKEGRKIGRMEGKAEGRKVGEMEGRKVGELEGRKLEQKRIAKELKDLGVPPEDIAKAIGLTIEEIQSL